jgi:hypothetical protein
VILLRREPLAACLSMLALAACQHDAQVHGIVTESGKGVPGVTLSIECPDGSKRTTSTNATGDFRFEGLGPGVDDRCTVQTLQTTGAGAWRTQAIATRCAQHDAGGLCTEAIFSFELAR